MGDPDKLARLRAEEIGEELAVGKAQRRMAHGEREMEDEMEEFDAREQRGEQETEQEWRREHWGHEPERRPDWQTKATERLILSRLPARVRDYVLRAVAQPPPGSGRVRLEQVGEMVLKPGGSARPFTAIEDLSVDRVDFTYLAGTVSACRTTVATGERRLQRGRR